MCSSCCVHKRWSLPYIWYDDSYATGQLRQHIIQKQKAVIVTRITRLYAYYMPWKTITNKKMSDFRFTFNRKETSWETYTLNNYKKRSNKRMLFWTRTRFFEHMYTRYSVKNIIVTKPEHSFIFCKSSFHFPSVTFLLILSSKNLA